MTLITFPNLVRVDDVYQWLVDAHEGRTDEESVRLNARLILTLINHIGDEAVIREAIKLAASTSHQQEDSQP